MAKILIVDDDQLLCETLAKMLVRKGHEVTTVITIHDALAHSAKNLYDVVFLDVKLPDGNGLAIIPELKSRDSKPEVVIMTGQGDPDGVETAIKSGAWCYLEKASITRELLLPLTRILEYREEKARKSSVKILDRENIVGNSHQLNKCLKTVASASCSDVNVLITGETGTGKEVFARTIHENSLRHDKGNFVVVDCAAIPESLVESTLFGHIKGSFTGADQSRKGLIKQADGGTLFLDEVGELPLQIQKSFLRVLQEQSYRAIGSSEEETSDFRLVAATNRDLDALVASGQFREDLLYRLRSLVIDLPPLRNRDNDVRKLAYHFMDRLSAKYDSETKGLSPEFLDALKAYTWPGNVRELFHALETVHAMAVDSPTYYIKHLPERIRISLSKASIAKFRPSTSTGEQKEMRELLNWKESKEQFESDYLQKLMKQTNNNITAACKFSGLSRSRLYQLLNKYSLQQ